MRALWVEQHGGPDALQACETVDARRGPGADVELNLQHLLYTSQSMVGRTRGRKGNLATILRHAAVGRLHVVSDRALPRAAAGPEQELLKCRQGVGKVVCGRPESL